MRKPLAMTAIAICAFAVATSSAQARPNSATRTQATTWHSQAVHFLRHKIGWNRSMAWHYQDIAGAHRTYSERAEKRTTSVPFLRWMRRLWVHRRVVARRSASHRRLATGPSSGLRAFAGPCLAEIIDQEDPSWSPTQWNVQGSGAYGLPQALPASKMASAGPDWRTNPYTQIRWMRGYTRGRYGSECGALAYKRAHGTY